MGDVVLHKVKGNLTAAEVKWETVVDLIAAGRVESDTLENFLTLAEVFGSFDFQKHTVQLIVHNRQSPDEQMIAVFDELELVLRDDCKQDAETRALVSQYLHAMSDQKQEIGQDLEDRLTCLKNTLTSANKQALELGDKELLVGDPISGAHGQATTVFAYAWYDNRWCIAKIGDPALMKDEWRQYQRATELYRSRSLVDILAFKTHEDKALLIMPYEAGLMLSHYGGLAARPSIVFDVVLCVLAALSALAYHGMSHNDIKPSNIVGACNAPHLFVLIDLVVYQELLRILAQPAFPRNLHEKHAARASAPTVARVFWELAECVKALAMRENVSTIDLEVVKPRPRSD
ncbi:hypothetical protein RI367_000959 [Sorochytrium milnesiophthora]